MPWWFQRSVGQLSDDRQRRWIHSLVLVQVTALGVMAATGSFLLAAAASPLIERVRALANGLLGAWIVPLTPRQRRATVLSTIEQADAVSQVTVGPGLGVIGRLFGIPAALVTSAVLLAPSAAVVARTGRRPGPAPGASPERIAP